MTTNRITTLSILLLCCLLGACGTVNTTSTRTTPALDEVPDARLQVNDLLTEIFLHCRGVRLYRSQPSNLLEAQIVVANDGFTTRTFAWNLRWLDQAGNLINSKTDVWRATSVPAGGTVTLTDLAPNASAADFSFELRRSDK
tara:strand:- start:2950 stop:3375 length:426 start_codon:yes stop_codon:yes gene_type:complete